MIYFAVFQNALHMGTYFNQDALHSVNPATVGGVLSHDHFDANMNTPVIMHHHYDCQASNCDDHAHDRKFHFIIYKSLLLRLRYVEYCI